MLHLKCQLNVNDRIIEEIKTAMEERLLRMQPKCVADKIFYHKPQPYYLRHPYYLKHKTKMKYGLSTTFLNLTNDIGSYKLHNIGNSDFLKHVL